MREGEEFLGNDRFEVITRLGQGGMGTVYQVHDRELKKRVALKTCGQVAGDKLLRFKREFRDLKSLVHPHIVALGELFEESGRWFFTMELVPGQTFLRHLRPPELSEGARSGAMLMPSTLGTLSAGAGLQAIGEPEAPPPVSAASFDELRLRRCLAQLATAIDAMHAHGHIHRDIKPSNVLVTPENRVVLIDFGLVTGRERERQSTEMRLTGTLLYMAPEQAAEKPLTPACDWYSFGVMLFQALTGRLPFEGQALQVMVKKQFQQAPLASSIVPGVPPDLDALCADLLRLDPKERPRGEDVLTALLVDTEKHDRANQSVSVQDGTGVFVGREAELSFLRERAARCLQGEQVSVLISGPSGIGKSALVSYFVEQARSVESSVLVFRGQCFEHERVPFNALDGVLDRVSRYLKGVDDSPFVGMSSDDIAFLARAFAVLQRVPAVQNLATHDPTVRDPQERRIRVIRALRALFINLARSHHVILAIEDLQWADEDSRTLLRELMRPPHAPPMMLLFTDRRPLDETEESGVSRPDEEAFIRLIPDEDHLRLRGLIAEDCDRLVASLVGETGEIGEELRLALAKQSGGHPYFLATLARRTPCSDAQHERSAPPDLDAVLVEMLHELPEPAQRLAEVICLAAARIPLEVVAEVAELCPDDLTRYLRALRIMRFARTTGPLRTDEVEPYHNRVREAVAASLDKTEARGMHRQLAQALEIHRCSAASIAAHWLACGETERASSHFATAAREASQALAFDNAASYYRLAAGFGNHGPLEKAALSRARGDALGSAGRGVESADAYLEAATSASGTEAIGLRRQATWQLLISGHYETGLQVIRGDLDRLRIHYPPTTLRALMALAWGRVRLRARGYEFKPSSEEEIRPDELLAIDVAFTVGLGLMIHDPVRSHAITVSAIRRSLDAGEPSRVARSLAWQSLSSALTHPDDVGRSRKIGDKARAIAERVGAPRVLAAVRFAEAFGIYTGAVDFALAAQKFSEVEGFLRDECEGVWWELNECLLAMNECDFMLGNWRSILERAPLQASEAETRGDRHLRDRVRGQYSSLAPMLDGDYDRAHEEIVEACAAVPEGRSPVELYVYRHTQLMVDIAAGRPETALKRFLDRQESFTEARIIRGAPFLRFWVMRDELMVRLAALGAGLPGAGIHERRVNQLIRSLGRQAAPPFHALRAYAEGVMNYRRGAVDDAIVKLREAGERYQDLSMLPHALACDARRGALIAQERGDELIENAHRWARDQGARDPEAVLRFLAPGLENVSRAVEESGP